MLRRYLNKSVTKQLYRNIIHARYYSENAKPASNLSDYVEIQEDHGVREITLNNPKTRNSLSGGMMAALKQAVEQNQDDINLRAIVISAKGKVWSAGHNLKEICQVIQENQGKDSESKVVPKKCADDVKAALNAFEQLFELIRSIKSSPVPVIAKVDGYAAAAGLQLALSCDITICSQQSQFSTPGSHVGIFCATPGVAVSQLVPRSKALYMLFTGTPITAEEAYASGLITKVVPDAKIDEAVEDFLTQLKKSSRAVVAHGKSTFYKTVDLPLEQAYEVACEAMMANLKLPDAQEGIESFLAKRKPNWTYKTD